jgi:anti-anti-sigma factor
VRHLHEGRRHFVVEMADLEYIGSMGIRCFLFVAKKAGEKQGAVLLCGMQGLVQEVFDTTHVTQMFRLFDTSEAALRTL